MREQVSWWEPSTGGRIERVVSSSEAKCRRSLPGLVPTQSNWWGLAVS